jgi:hypothetical protein
MPHFAGEFRDFDDWVSFATKRLTGTTGSVGQEVPPICVDTLGRRCNVGADFMRARDEETFPVRFFWECKAPPGPDYDLCINETSPAELRALAEELRAHSMKSVDGIKSNEDLDRRLCWSANSLMCGDGGPTITSSHRAALDFIAQLLNIRAHELDQLRPSYFREDNPTNCLHTSPTTS